MARKYLTGKEAVRRYNMSQNLMEMMRLKKIPRRELSKRTGFTVSKIGTLATGKRLPTDEDIDIFAKIFDCDAEYLKRIELDPFGDYDESDEKEN